MTSKLHKVLAERGLGSRREMERWIARGDVTVNGKVAELGVRVTQDDKIAVKGEPLKALTTRTTRMLIANKREGVIVSRKDPKGRATIFDNLPERSEGRWLTVGRLDLNTQGLILFTDSGELANRLMHPSTGLDREYAVRVDGKLSDEQQQQLRDGIEVEGHLECFSDIRYYNGSESNHWYHVVLMEGRNREVRRLFEHAGLRVTRLKRVRFGPVILPSWLKRGQWAELDARDVQAIRKLVGLPVEKVAPTKAKGKKHPKKPSDKKRKSVLIPYPGL